ncbi:MAG: universal stress protein [Caldilineaceae bacterium]|nr:universal stress protein [Caldilineaceae bacterium]
MYHRILVPLDGSPFAEGIFGYLSQVDQQGDSEIVLVQILEQERYGAYLTPGPLPISGQPISEWKQHAEQYHETVAMGLRKQGYEVRSLIVHGNDVAGEICRLADEERVNLIAMTTHGRAGLPRWLMGSVASRVVSATDKPVFLVHPNAHTRERAVSLRRILVPLDGSRLAELALNVAGALARSREAGLILVRALEPAAVIGANSATSDAAAPVPAEAPVHSIERDAADLYMADVLEVMNNTNTVEQSLIVHGSPAEVILDTAEMNDADLIIMSTHGRSGVSRWVYGSVAEKVLHSAPCPLLLLRAPR